MLDRFFLKSWFVHAPDDGAAGGSATPAAAPSGAPAAAPAPSPSPTPSPAPAATPAAGGAPAGASPSSGAASTEYVGIREAARGYGFDLSGQPDDHAALQHLILQARRAGELQQLAQHGQRYVQHAADFERWQAEQRKQQQTQQAQSWWKAPEFDPSWLSQVTRDPQTGELKPVAGASPAIVQKVQEALAHQQDFLRKFAFDPIGSIKPGIEQVVKELAGQLVQQQIGSYSGQEYARSFIQQHSGWLHQRDAQGQVVAGPNGTPQLSAWGQLFAQNVAKAERMGIANEQARAEYGLEMVRAAYAQHAARTAQAQQAGQQAKETLVQQGRQAAAPGVGRTATPPNVGATQTPPAARPLPLRERMLQNLKKAGITPEQMGAR